MAWIGIADYVIRRRSPRWIVVGMFDHPAHVATAALIFLNLPPRSPAWTSGYFAGSLLPDLDHVPLALRPVHPSPGDPRPLSHCLLAVAPVAAVIAASPRACWPTSPGTSASAPGYRCWAGNRALAWPALSRYLAACALLARRGAKAGNALP
jgi:hypothetical protein